MEANLEMMIMRFAESSFPVLVACYLLVKVDNRLAALTEKVTELIIKMERERESERS